jgi:hypothetical protein
MEISHEDQVAMEHVIESDAEALMKDRLLSTEPLPQSECMLYSKIPGEIRTRIFALTLREFEDKSKPYRPNRVYYRPGFHYHTKQDTRLLQTCRLVYQEARMMPVTLTEFVYWIYGGPSHYCQNRYPGRLDLSMKMTSEQIGAIETIHLFVEQASLERGDPFAAPTSCKKFKITLRYSDWWSWESAVDSDDKLGICPWRSGRTTHEEMLAEPREKDLRRRWDEIRRDNTDPEEAGTSGVWGYELQFISGLESLEMKFETDIRKKSQLEAVVDRAKFWRIPMDNQSELKWTGEMRESTWTGMERQRVDEDYDDDSDTDQEFEEDAGDREFVDLASASQPGSAELTVQVGALAITDETEAERADTSSLLKKPMRTYFVVNMTWDVRKSALGNDEAVAAGGSPKDK